MTYEEYGIYYPYQNYYRNKELVKTAKELVKSKSFSEIKAHLKEYCLEDENDFKDWDENATKEICVKNEKVLSLSEPKLREFAFKDQKHLMMCHEDKDIDQFIEDYLK